MRDEILDSIRTATPFTPQAAAGLFAALTAKTSALAPLPLGAEAFAAPVESVVSALSAVASLGLQLRQHATYYQAASEDCAPHGSASMGYEGEHVAQLALRRAASMVPGGVGLQSTPLPEPVESPTEATQSLLATAQLLQASLQQLIRLLGEHPSAHSFRAQSASLQESMDRTKMSLDRELIRGVNAQGRMAVAKAASMAAIDVAQLEGAGAFAQAQNEAAFLRSRLVETQEMLEQAKGEAEQAQQAVAESQQAQQETAAATQQAQQQALAAQNEATQRAIQTTDLAMRHQQLRSQLADLARQDAVSEEGVSPGAPPPLSGAQQAQQAQAAQEQALQAQAAGAEQPAQTAPVQKVAAFLRRLRGLKTATPNLGALVPGAKTTAQELGAALRFKTQQRGAQEMAKALAPHLAAPVKKVAPPPAWVTGQAASLPKPAWLTPPRVG